MIESRKCILSKYLYPTEEIAEFMFKDLYLELGKIITTEICISSNNLYDNIRKKNFAITDYLISKFINENPEYKKMLIELYADNDLDYIANNIMLGYVFYISISKCKNSEPDILRDKTCITFTPLFPVESL